MTSMTVFLAAVIVLLSYNAHVWEEYHLGLFEVLEAVARKSFSWKFKKFYVEAMAIANRGTKIG